jgi:PAB-dependent poly(A)-specific ribonuclease subunit 2
VFWHNVGFTWEPPHHIPDIYLASNAIELIDYGREPTEVDYALMIQSFHRFLLDHLSSEGNSFPHNPLVLKIPSLIQPALLPVAAPVTQLLGIDAKNLITCMNCKAVREKENMTHVIDLTYPRPVSKYHALAYLFRH